MAASSSVAAIQALEAEVSRDGTSHSLNERMAVLLVDIGQQTPIGRSPQQHKSKATSLYLTLS